MFYHVNCLLPSRHRSNGSSSDGSSSRNSFSVTVDNGLKAKQHRRACVRARTHTHTLTYVHPKVINLQKNKNKTKQKKKWVE